MSTDKDDDIMMAVVAAFLGTFLFYLGFKTRKTYKIIECTPRSKTRSVALGLVEVQGLAQIYSEALISPFSKSECVYYSYKVEEERGSGKRRSWVTIASFSSSDPFYLQDETGRIEIRPQGATTKLKIDQNFRTSFFFNDKNEQLFIEGLQNLGITYTGLFGSKKLRCQETYIAPKDRLYVLGTATDAQKSTRSEINSENICICKDKNSIFYLSDSSEKDLLKSMFLTTYGFIIGGPILAIWGIAYLLFRFGLI